MRRSHFWSLMEGEFGSAYAHSLAGAHALHALGDLTVEQALESGVPARRIWEALCDDMDVPMARRLGDDPAPRPVPRSVLDSIGD